MMKVTTEVQMSITLEQELSNESFENLYHSDYGELNEKYCKLLEDSIIKSLKLDILDYVINHRINIKNFVRD